MQRWGQGPLTLLSGDQAAVPPVLWPTAHPRRPGPPRSPGKEAAGGMKWGWGGGPAPRCPLSLAIVREW